MNQTYLQISHLSLQINIRDSSLNSFLQTCCGVSQMFGFIFELVKVLWVIHIFQQSLKNIFPASDQHWNREILLIKKFVNYNLLLTSSFSRFFPVDKGLSCINSCEKVVQNIDIFWALAENSVLKIILNVETRNYFSWTSYIFRQVVGVHKTMSQIILDLLLDQMNLTLWLSHYMEDVIKLSLWLALIWKMVIGLKLFVSQNYFMTRDTKFYLSALVFPPQLLVPQLRISIVGDTRVWQTADEEAVIFSKMQHFQVRNVALKMFLEIIFG